MSQCNFPRDAIFLEGGGGCITGGECAKRAGSLSVTSTGMPDSYTGTTLLADVGEFAGADLLAAHYCTSDLWTPSFTYHVSLHFVSIPHTCPEPLDNLDTSPPPPSRARAPPSRSSLQIGS